VKTHTLALLLGTLCFASDSHAYEMWVRMIIGPRYDCVHERLTLASQACLNKRVCVPVSRACDVPEWGGIRDGVRWNDDPLRLLNYGSTYLRSGAYFTHGQRVSVKDPTRVGVRWNTHYRSHYGDMQFVHSMASFPQDSASQTQQRVLLWTEFMYRVAVADIDPASPLKDVPIAGIPAMFEGKSWTVRGLLTMRCTSRDDCIFEDRPDERVRLTALGSLLHTVQDSFSASHARRNLSIDGDDALRRVCFGPIHTFFYYPSQRPQVHETADQSQDWMSFPLARDCLNPVTASAEVLELAGVGATSAPQPWSVAHRYLRETVFALEIQPGEARTRPAPKSRAGYR
jgi:hypothetical protein